MSEESQKERPPTLMERVDAYMAGARPGQARFQNDEAVMSMVQESQFPDQTPPPPPSEEPPIPPEYAYDPAKAEYQALAKRPDFMKLRSRMQQELAGEDWIRADGSEERFVWGFRMIEEKARQEREEFVERRKQEIKKHLAQREKENAILRKSSGATPSPEEVEIAARRFFK